METLRQVVEEYIRGNQYKQGKNRRYTHNASSLHEVVQKIGATSNQIFSILQDWNESLKGSPLDIYSHPEP